MGRKRTVEDYQRTAEENDWVPGPYEEEIAYSRRRTTFNQQETLDQWIMRVLDSSYRLIQEPQLFSFTGILTGSV